MKIGSRRKPREYSVYMVAVGVWDAYEVVAIYEDRRMARWKALECAAANALAGDATRSVWVEDILLDTAQASA